MADILSPPLPGQELSSAEAETVLKQLAGVPDLVWDTRSAPAWRRAGQAEEAAVDEPAALPPAQVPTLTGDVLGRLLEALPDALLIVDQDGRIVLTNGQAEKLFGYRREELFGQLIEILVPPRFRKQHVADRVGFVKSPHVRPMGRGLGLVGLRKDGQEVPVEISLSPLQSDDRLLIVSTIRDVSERRKAEAHLHKLEARYRTLVEGIPAVTFMASLDEGFNELYVSPQVEELLGFTQKEWLENPVLWYRQLHPEDRERWHQEFARTCALAEPFSSVYRFISRDGRVVWVHGEAKVVRDDDGRPLFLQGVAFDITGIKQAEEELRALNQTLEQRVAERTQALEERARELERSNRAKEDFNYFVGHELKKPLAPLLDDAKELVQRHKGKRDSEIEERLQRIVRTVHDMDLRIRRMLEYAKVGETECRPVNCAEVFHAACDRLRGDIEGSGARVTARRLPVVLSNPTDLVQVFENLIGNAIKYRAKKRALKVSVQAERQEEEWLFRVKDNAEGIELRPKDPEFIFKLFKRNHGEEIPGHGIGLAFCKKVIEHHGGRIWVESTYGKGSTFFFTLPAVPATELPQDPQAMEPPVTSASPRATPAGKPARAPTSRQEKSKGRGRRGK